MPKATPRLEASKQAKARAATEGSSRPSTTKSRGPRLYSNFLPIPLLLPSSTATASSSKTPSAAITHYVYCRAHEPRKPASEDDEGRTVFVVNLPVDFGERELRGVFGQWGVVESVQVGKEEVGDVLESAVRGIDDEDEDDEDEDEENATEEEAPTTEPTFQGDLNTAQSRSARRKARKGLPPSIPEVIPLSPLDPRSTPFGISGLHSAHIRYLDKLSLTRLLSSTHLSPISVTLGSGATGLEYYKSLHRSLRPSLTQIKTFADSSMSRFDHLHSLLLSSRAKQRGAGALVDEDGFTVVVRSGKYGRAGARGDGLGNKGVGITSQSAIKKTLSKKKGKGAQELDGFYKFQKLDQKRRELADLRSKFEQDKAKVDELKKSRRFKPY